MTADEFRAQINQAVAPLMPGGESTSTRLRRVSQERTQLAVALLAVREELRQEQTARAASQADLTKALAERDRFIAAADKLHGEWLDLKADLARVEGERDTAETWARTLNGALIAARAELASARQELARLRGGAA